jgi:hypothetical protein
MLSSTAAAAAADAAAAGAGGSIGGGDDDYGLAANDKFVVNIVPRRAPPAVPVTNRAAESTAFGAKNTTESFGPREGASRSGPSQRASKLCATKFGSADNKLQRLRAPVMGVFSGRRTKKNAATAVARESVCMREGAVDAAAERKGRKERLAVRGGMSARVAARKGDS